MGMDSPPQRSDQTSCQLISACDACLSTQEKKGWANPAPIRQTQEFEESRARRSFSIRRGVKRPMVLYPVGTLGCHSGTCLCSVCVWI